MSSIAIVTDTDSDLPNEIAAKYNIRQVPITVHFGDEVLETGVDINNTQLFERIDREGELPTTAAPSPGKFAAAYKSAFEDDADSVIWLAILIWGTIRRELWAWWGALLTFGLLTFSSILALSRYSWADLLNLMKFAETELEALGGVPLQGFHLIPIVGIPLFLTLVVILYSRSYFGVRSSNLTESQPFVESN